MVNATDEFKVWRKSFDEAFKTGEPYSQGYPIEGTDDDANQVGQRYFGPVVLITDALAFSTADMFAAGFMDHEIGKVICTDENMAAAGGNNWYPWELLRLFNPDFGIDLSLKAAFEAGTLVPAVQDAFNQHGESLSSHAILSAGQSQYDGLVWRITDGVLTHVVRYLPWMNGPLRVYLDESSIGLRDMPSGIIISLTMRRCVRTAKSEGRLLEDLGIQPDSTYRMTVRDVTDKNQDLFTEASRVISQMPVYGLDVKATPQGGNYVLECTTSNLSSLEVFGGEKYVAGSPVSGASPVQITVPSALTSAEVRGFHKDALVIRTMVSLHA
jgi:hypothetical protein